MSGSVADNTHEQLEPIYGPLSTNHLIRKLREDEEVTANDDWYAYLQANSSLPEGSINDLLSTFEVPE